MQVQAVNQYAVTKYREFEWAIETVRESLEATERLVNGMAEQSPGRFQGWQVPTKKEVQETRKKAVALLDGLRKKAKEFEAELLSRGWRV